MFYDLNNTCHTHHDLLHCPGATSMVVIIMVTGQELPDFLVAPDHPEEAASVRAPQEAIWRTDRGWVYGFFFVLEIIIVINNPGFNKSLSFAYLYRRSVCWPLWWLSLHFLVFQQENFLSAEKVPLYPTNQKTASIMVQGRERSRIKTFNFIFIYTFKQNI